MTNGELLERIDGTTKEIIANQAYQLGIDDGYKSGIINSFIDIKKEFEYLLNSGMGKQKCLEHLIKIADKNIKYEQNYDIETKIDNKPNLPMSKDYDKFTFDPKLAEEYARKAADISGMSLEEFVKVNNKPVGVINRPKHIIVNGALYEKIDDSIMMISGEYMK